MPAFIFVFMQQHRGEIVEEAIRKSGYHIKKLAARLKISRNTLYNRFKEPNLSYKFILQVAHIIHYDFSLHFPDLKHDPPILSQEEATYVHPSVKELRLLQGKYIDLLEHHNKLWCMLVKMANNNELPGIKQEINHFLASETAST